MAGQDQPTTTSPPSASVSNDGSSGRHGIDEQIAERRAKLAALAAAGVAVHPYRFDRTATTAELHASYADLAPDAHTGAAGPRRRSPPGRPGSRQARVRRPPRRVAAASSCCSSTTSSTRRPAGGRQPRRGRLGRGRGRGGHVPPGRALDRGGGADPAHQGAPAAARPPCRRGRSGDEVPRARGRPHRQRRRQAGLRRPPPHDRRAARASCRPRASSRWRPRSCRLRPVVPSPGPSRPTPTPSTSTSACGSRPSSTSSGSSSVATSGCSRSARTSATRASTPATAPSSRPWRPTAPWATCTTGWTSPSG